MMSEELRLLYVAMTRAKEKLILTLALTEGARALERLGRICPFLFPLWLWSGSRT